MNRRLLIIGALAAVAVVVLWFLLLWSPRSDDIDEARERTELAEQQNSELETRIQRLRRDQANEPQLRATLERLRTAVPDQPNLAQFILDANDAALRAGIDFISIAPTPPAAATATPGAAVAPATGTAPSGVPTAVTGTAPAEIKLALQIGGGYFQVLDFLNRLDTLPRIVVVDGLNLNGDQTGRLTANVTARMFVQPSAVVVPGAPIATTTTTTTTAPGGATTTTAPGGATTTTTRQP